ncbi:LEAF RUST 10 DISEASE-RESISTANCE LOCUS RECEPTOR-LIKE PROTEIN KINASE-like 2.8 isoform X2 [Prosopis cineraria]|uniref:LEAF RUST 10 DISEASE-RESISTANCE LOCUS RECEPTOR-LIKE PROTEIN KINASE-like 2.8 isoform X2 n=1 Tax=Prosopis cineraria TaxID=364024 RepID=UPI00240F6022|nr:LEAF RUST 10 DISEASE-RESISTANCE LOCUS RECEPTOR-LIKE PROTEIN KINASE-like 2.8 isoform X2 [Prosopis cineraria]
MNRNFCSTDFRNNTFDPALFHYVDGFMNVTFLYNCTSVPARYDSAYYCDAPNFSELVYYSLEPVYTGNCKSVIMPMSYQENVADVGTIFRLKLKWMVSNEECERCSISGGQCGYDGHQFSCFCNDGAQTTSCSQSQGSSGSTKKLGPRLALAISAGVIGIALISILIIYNCKKHFRIEGRKIFKERRAYHDNNLQSFVNNYGSLAPRKYSYSEVIRMTKSFSDKLGEGGYGVVYKASLPDGRLVAVKVIRESKGSGEEFINEVASISRTSHINIVILLGFCYESNKRVLIYEYMSNGSLDNFIYKRGSPNAFCTLEWKVLYQVAIGIARGLEYLHQGCNTRILHLDIKPQNILLDDEFCPKISDFGLSKLCQKRESIVSIGGTRGTVGFIAPEIFNRAFGGVSHKADVYSYGMLILEMVGGRKNYDSGGSLIEEMYFPYRIYEDLEQGNHQANSSTIIEDENEVVWKMKLVSLWCIQINPLDRPAMSKVVEMLEGSLQSLSIPPKPTLQSPTTSLIHSLKGSSEETVQLNSIRT